VTVVFEGIVGLIAHPYSTRGDTGRGGDRYVSELVSGLTTLDVPLRVLDSGFITSFAAGILKEIQFPWRLWREKATLFHATSPVGAKTALALGKRPLVTTIHDVLPLYYKGQYDFGPKMHFKAACIRMAAKHSDQIIVPYPAIRDALLERTDVDPSRLHLIAYGANSTLFGPGSVVKPGIPRLLFVGEVGRNKGVDTLLEAFRVLLDRGVETRLTIAGGWGPESEGLQAYAARLRLDEMATFAGYVPDSELPQLYRSASVFVFPSRYGFGLPTLEAMACGTPTVSGDCFDAADFVGDAGLLVPPGDAAALADAVEKILTDENCRSTLIKRGYRQAERFTWERTARETCAVYRAAIGRAN
jgi:alpha-1,3-rhamnosyl/mannosyltransferase